MGGADVQWMKEESEGGRNGGRTGAGRMWQRGGKRRCWYS